MIRRILMMLGLGKPPPMPQSEDVEQAITLARRVRQRADHLNDILEDYAKSPNAFGRFAADVINRDFDQPRAK